MKRAKVIISIVAIVIVMNFVISSFYPRTGVVTEIDEENEVITVTCENGNVFSFHSSGNDWLCGDFCGLIMFDGFTKDIYDDAVMSARYQGYLKLYQKICDNNYEEL